MDDGAVSPQVAFDQAVKEFNSGNAQQALSLFQSIRKTGFSSADLELNLSKAYFKTGDSFHALEHAQAGVFLTRINSEARNDLKTIQKAVPAGYGERLDHPSEISWTIYSYIRPSEGFAVGAFLLFLFLLGAVLRRSLWTRASVLMLSVATISILLGVAALPAKTLALVNSEGAELRSSPIKSADVSMRIPAGSRIKIRQIRGEFAEIERPNSFRGWVSTSSVSKVL